MEIDYKEALIKYPYRTPLGFFHEPWMVDLVRGKRVCDLGCQAGDAMVQMAKYASSVSGVEILRDYFDKAKARGLDVKFGSWDDVLPEADVYHVWAKHQAEVKRIAGRVAGFGAVLVFQAPVEWVNDASLWEVPPKKFTQKPVIRPEVLSSLAKDLGGGELEFKAYSFSEPESVREEFSRDGWRQVFVLRTKVESDKKKVKLLLIAGQHRSGTSMLTGSLEKLGCFLGTDTVIEPDQYNEKGYFENRPMFEWHVQAIRAFGAADGWQQFSPFPIGFEDSQKAQPIIQGMRKALRGELDAAAGRPLVIKDPRMSFLMPLYARATASMPDVDVCVLFSDRRDGEIIDSLKRRNGFDHNRTKGLIDAHRNAFIRDKGSFDYEWVSTFDCLQYKPEKFFRWLNKRFSLGLDPEKIGDVQEFVDMKLRHHQKGKVVKVVSTYFGPRRTYPHMVDETVTWLKEIVGFERSLDKGVFCDTIIVNHDIAAILPGGEKAHEYLESIDGMPTRNGVIKVVNRPWDRGVGASYGSFSYAFGLFRNEYEWWWFTEDNVVQIRGGYMAEMIEKIRGTGAAFVCGLEWKTVQETKKLWPLHCHGGCGGAHRDVLNRIYDRDGCLPHCKDPMPESVLSMVESGLPYKLQDEAGRAWYFKFERQGEVMFTNILVQEGLDLVDLKTGPLSRWRGVVY